jgi:type IV pilus assembly protein PilV
MSARPRFPTTAAHQQRGAILIEVMVSILICAFGLLGFVALQARASTSEFEAYQRSQALVLLEDMTNRLNANRAEAGSYVTSGLIGGGAMADCTALTTTTTARDLCEWGNLLRGSAETRNGSATGAMVGARGCISRAAGSTERYVVSIAWVGIVPTGAPASTCGKDDAAFANEALRRVVSTTVCMAQLRDAASAPAVPRC